MCYPPQTGSRHQVLSCSSHPKQRFPLSYSSVIFQFSFLNFLPGFFSTICLKTLPRLLAARGAVPRRGTDSMKDRGAPCCWVQTPKAALKRETAITLCTETYPVPNTTHLYRAVKTHPYRMLKMIPIYYIQEASAAALVAVSNLKAFAGARLQHNLEE